MTRIHRALAAALLVLAASPAPAQPSLPFDLPPPYDGAFYDPAQPGIGLWLDNGPAGTSFGALMYYAPDGRPTFATFAARLGFTGSLGEAFTGVRGLLGPLWQSVDGQCLGCPWRAPRSSPIDGAFLVQIGHRDAFVSHAGSRFPMGAIPLGQPETSLPEGTWWLALDDLEQRTSSTSTTYREIHELQAVVRIAPREGVRFAPAPGGPLDPRYPKPASVVHEVACVASCGDFEEWRRAAGEDARVFVFGSGAINQFWNATFGRWVDGADGFAPAADSLLHNLKLDPWVMHSASTTQRAPRLALYRSPVTAPCDGDVACRSELASANDAVPGYASDGGYAWLARGLSGAFLDPQQPGTGLWIDAGRNGETFMTLMTYAARADGGSDPVFYTLGGPIRRFTGGIFGYTGVSSPLYESRDGQRLGGPWRVPTTRIATELGLASVRLFSQDALRLDVAGASYQMVALRPDLTPRELPLGRWLLTLRDQLEFDPDSGRPSGQPFARIESVTAEVELVPADIVRGVGSESPALQVPSEAARTYAVTCSASCGDFDAWRAGHELVLWVEPNGIATLSQAARQLVLGTFIPLTAKQYGLELMDDAIEGYGGRLATPTAEGRSFNRAVLRMHRNPPRAFCDTDAACN